jgi:type II restriction/modification system DNA methylase subunit YeeA
MNDIKMNLKELVDKFDKDYEYYKDARKYNENNCRLEFIDEFFKILGWDISNKQGKSPQYREVITENYQADTGRPDYTMTLNGIGKFHVEAKKPSVEIQENTKPAIQARSYGWNSKLRISVLTNFEYLIIYDTSILPTDNDDAKTAAIKMYNYKEYIDNIEEIYNLISKESVYNGNFETELDLSGYKIYDKGLHLPVDEYFLKSINRWRLDIGNYLYKVKEYNIDIINDYVQEFINQIVFIRICEDRNLPVYHNMKDILDEKEFVCELDRLFREADKKYNSGLFQYDTLIFDLNNEIIRNMIEELYYPKSPYEFNFIQPNILGEIYELFLGEQLVVQDGQVILQKKSVNLHRDIVTTPIEIVKYIVNRVLGEYCRNKEPKDILNIRVADIACGSGIFLIEAYDWLINYITDWYSKNDSKHLVHNSDGGYKLSFDEKKEILEKCIWGIDIDIHAIEVAKFNLLIKLLESETEPSLRGKEHVLPDLNSNIKCGNSLIDFKKINYSKLTQEDKNQIVPFEWSNINDGNPFDIIIGNPPYVSTEDMKNLLNSKEVKAYKSKYNTCKGQFDKYFVFVERALEKVKEYGIVSYIIPNKFSKIKAGEALREKLSKDKYVKEYIDFGSLQLFKERDKTVYSSILTLQKCSQDKFTFIEVDNLSKWFAKTELKEIEIESGVLGSLPWALVSNEEDMELIKKMYRNSTELGKEVELFNGIQTSAERPPIYWFGNKEIVSEDETYFKIKRNEKEYLIEKDILKRYYKPVLQSEKNLGSFDIFETDKYIIFPYNFEGKLYNLDIMEKQYPNTLDYLKDNYLELKPKQIGGTRRDVPLATEDTWYQYGRDQALTAFNNKKKLIVGVLSKKAMYLYDDNNYVISSGGTAGYCAISEKEESKYKLEFIQAYLTHPFSEKLLSIIGSDFDNSFYSRGTNILDRFPLKMIDFEDEYQSKLYDDIVSNVRRIHEINKSLKSRLPKSSKVVLLDEKNYLIDNTEQLVTKVYNLV